MYNSAVWTYQAARATPIDSATPNTKARTAAFVEAQATSPSPNVATSAAQAFADHISWSGAPRVRAKIGSAATYRVLQCQMVVDHKSNSGSYVLCNTPDA